MDIFNEIRDRYKLEGVTISDLLHFSDFIKTETTTFDEKTLWKHIKPILSKAIVAFQKTREAEGVYISKDLKKILKEISRTLAQVGKKSPVRISEYSKSLTERIKKLIDSAPDPMRIATEVAIFADRLDISEEWHPSEGAHTGSSVRIWIWMSLSGRG